VYLIDHDNSARRGVLIRVQDRLWGGGCETNGGRDKREALTKSYQEIRG
jgi:hypothetical protein